MPAGTHWQGIWETVIEVPTAQRTLSLTSADPDGAVQVNTASNMLQVDVSAQYRIDPDKADDLYRAYQDQFADLRQFEAVNLEPAIKGAINYAIGDMDTATALTTAGKQKAEQEALKTLNDEWGGARHRLLQPDDPRHRAGSGQQRPAFHDAGQRCRKLTMPVWRCSSRASTTRPCCRQATAEAKVNRLQNSTLTDLYVQDQELGQVKKLYLPSDQLMGLFNK